MAWPLSLVLMLLGLSACSLCIWNITVLEDKFILIQFIKVDIEDQLGCDHDYVTFHSSEGKLVGM